MESIELGAAQIQLLTSKQAWHYHIVPKSGEHGELIFYAASPSTQLKQELEVLFGKKVSFETVDEPLIQQALATYYRNQQMDRELNMNSGDEQHFLSDLLTEARSMNASDIHLERYKENCRIRFRIDGSLIERYVLPVEQYPALVNKIKIQARMDISERRLPQDGRMNASWGDQSRKIDLRVSSLPTLYGEKMVLRLLSDDSSQVELSALGFAEHDLGLYLDAVKRPNGMVLISGPTGSGKTTTLYATLKLLNQEKTNIVTIEDPVEYTLEGINQVQVKPNIGLTFSTAIRSFLRQDPDIIMLGEIRDLETAEMAVRAALTGHLVLSTLHTNSAWDTVTRMIDMGVPPYLLASTLRASVAQRLVKKLCKTCKVWRPVEHADWPTGYHPPEKLKEIAHPTGCKDCFFTGYKGRVAVYEVIGISDPYQRAIREVQADVSEQVAADNRSTLSTNAFEWLKQGVTSLEEVAPLLL